MGNFEGNKKDVPDRQPNEYLPKKPGLGMVEQDSPPMTLRSVTRPNPMRFLIRGMHVTLIFTAMLLAFRGRADAAQVHRLNPDEMRLFNLVSQHAGQMRAATNLDPILCKVARQKAMDMERRSYFSHVDPGGVGPNRLVSRAGYVLPATYSAEMSSNNIESIAMAAGNMAEPFELWLRSGSHRPHLLGENPWYAAQTSVGVGVYRSGRFPYYKMVVLITAPPNASRRPPPLVLKAPNGRTLADTRAVLPFLFP